MSSNPVQPPMGGPAVIHDLTSGEEGKKKRRHKPSIRVAALNITSMMDLVLNLLLFFVLTASFAAGEGILPAKLPTGGQDGSGAPVESELATSPEIPVVVMLVPSGRADQNAIIQVEGSPDAIGSYQELYEKLRSWQRNDTNAEGIYKPDQSIVIRPGRDVKWDQVVEAFNALVRAKYTNIGFAPPG